MSRKPQGKKKMVRQGRTAQAKILFEKMKIPRQLPKETLEFLRQHGKRPLEPFKVDFSGQLCYYSGDGKLLMVKIGRNWVTVKELAE